MLHALALLATFVSLAATAQTRLEWDARDSTHPILGAVRLAYLKRLAETPVDGAAIYSRVFISCQKDVRKVAIELANAMKPSDLVGLHAAAEPRLSCRRAVDGKTVEEPILVNWEVNAKLGDVLTRGLRSFPLRECESIAVAQEVRMPDATSAPIAFEIVPSDPAIESVFMACGERPATAPAQPIPPAPIVAAPAPPAQPAWKDAHALSTGGRTNVREAPRIDARVVVRLAPGTRVRVREADGDWVRARQAVGNAFEGWIHKDRLSFK